MTSYIGNLPTAGAFIKLDDISGGFNGSATAFNLTASSVTVLVGSANNLLISVNGVLQEPGSAYTVSGNQITFSTAPASGSTFFGVKLGHVLNYAIPSDASITPAKLINSGHESELKNYAINSAMAVDQLNLGATQTITAGAALAYTVDQWYAYCTGSSITGQRVAGTIANTYRYRFTGAASNTAVGFGARLESIRVAELAGQNATLQVKLSSTSLTTITWTAYYANSNDTFGTLASPTRTQITTGNFTINGTETIYSAGFSVPGAATTGIEIVFTGGALIGGQTLTIGDVSLTRGSTVFPFKAREISTEIELCRRYQRIWNYSAGGYPVCLGQATSTTSATMIGIGDNTSTMRVSPTITSSAAANFIVTLANGSTTAATAVSFGVGNGGSIYGVVDVASGLVAGNSTSLQSSISNPVRFVASSNL